MFLSARPGQGATALSRPYCNKWLAFYPHAPGRARRQIKTLMAGVDEFLSARPGQGATRNKYERGHQVQVSIRTPRAGRDVFVPAAAIQVELVSIRTPRAGRDMVA